MTMDSTDYNVIVQDKTKDLSLWMKKEQIKFDIFKSVNVIKWEKHKGKLYLLMQVFT